MITEKTFCPNCNRVLRTANAWHYCKQVDIDDLFLNKPDDVVLAFDKLLQTVANWAEVEISATKNCVVFVRNKTFLVAKPMIKFLEIKFYNNEIFDDEDLHKCQRWGSKYEGIVRVVNAQQLTTKFLNYIKNSYKIS